MGSTEPSGRTLVLGGGFGGIAAAVELNRLLGDDHEVVLVDRKPEFTMGLRKLWELVGLGTIAEGSRTASLLARHGIDVVAGGDPRRSTRAVGAAETTGGRLGGDHLVIALGAVSRPDLVPGLAEHGHDVWAFAGVPAAAAALARFDGGRLLILIAGAPYPCPPAPYECAFHLDEHLRARGLRDRTELAVVDSAADVDAERGLGGLRVDGRATRRARHLVSASVPRPSASKPAASSSPTAARSRSTC